MPASAGPRVMRSTTCTAYASRKPPTCGATCSPPSPCPPYPPSTRRAGAFSPTSPHLVRQPQPPTPHAHPVLGLHHPRDHPHFRCGLAWHQSPMWEAVWADRPFPGQCPCIADESWCLLLLLQQAPQQLLFPPSPPNADPAYYPSGPSFLLQRAAEQRVIMFKTILQTLDQNSRITVFILMQ